MRFTQTKIAKGTRIVFKGGCIKNGILKGQETKIEGDTISIFDNVKIEGNWIVPNISTKMFVSLDTDNSLLNVFALANPNVKNRIHITEGHYRVRATTKLQHVLRVPSNTDVIIDGTIQMQPNDLKNYSVLSISGAQNIHVTGKGELRGDKHEHLDTKGEWGMCIRITNSDKVEIHHMLITNAWGDCIYVGKGSKRINIHNCTIDEGRRQGISVIAGVDVRISDCLITNVYGTNPQYGIDVEPNNKDIVKRVSIERVTIHDCIGGIIIHGKEHDNKYSITDALINECKISCSSTHTPISITKCTNPTVKKCTINKGRKSFAISVKKCGNIVIKNNQVNYEAKPLYYKDCQSISF